MQKNKKMRLLLSAGLGFFLTLFLFLLLVSLELLPGLCSDNTLRRSVKESRYRQKAYDEFCKKADDLFADKGIEMNWEELFPDIDTDFTQYEEAVYQGKKADSDREQIEKKVEASVREYLEDSGTEISDEIEREIQTKAKEVGSLYERYFEPEFLEQIYQQKESLKKRSVVLILLSVLVAVGLNVLLFRMYRHKYRALRFVTGAVFASAAWNLIGLFWIKNQMQISKFDLGSKAYQGFLQKYLNTAGPPCVIFTVVWILIGILLVSLGRKWKHS